MQMALSECYKELSHGRSVLVCTVLDWLEAEYPREVTSVLVAAAPCAHAMVTSVVEVSPVWRDAKIVSAKREKRAITMGLPDSDENFRPFHYAVRRKHLKRAKLEDTVVFVTAHEYAHVMQLECLPTSNQRPELLDGREDDANGFATTVVARWKARKGER